MRRISRRTILLAAATSLAGASLPAAAQDYPKKTTIRIIVPQAVGSATDTVARILAQRIAANLGQQMIVDNRPGAGGLLGGELTSKAPPDGYTLKRSGAGGRSPVLRRLDERRPPVERTFA